MDIYHRTVGRNGVLELDVAVDKAGRIREDHAQRYQEMGEYIRLCYGQPSFQVENVQGYLLEWELEPTLTDRIWLREDQGRGGQRIRQYKVYVRTTMHPNQWTLFSQGHSVGNKRIDIGSSMWMITALKVHVEVASHSLQGRECVLIGHAGHPEVEGTMGQYDRIDRVTPVDRN